METVSYSVKSAVKASRMELLMRILWAILTGIVLAVFRIIAVIAVICQIILVLVNGEKNMTLNSWIQKYVGYIAKRHSYLMLLTDERSPILPED